MCVLKKKVDGKLNFIENLIIFQGECDWTDEKSCFLIYGVKFYGSNDWQSIARYYRSVLNNCEPQELKAKYQLLKLTNQLETQQKAIEHHLKQTLEMIIKVEKN
jgi:hypothetical protein